MHQKRNGVQVGVGFAVTVAEGCGAAVEGCGAVGGAGLEAAGTGGGDSGARLLVGAAGAVLLVTEAVAEAVRLAPVRCVVGAAGTVVTPVAVGGAAEVGPLGVGVATGPPAAGAGEAPSLPFAARAATPSPATARPTTESASTPARRAGRRPERRDRAGAADRPAAGGGATAGGGPAAGGPWDSVRVASGRVSRVAAGAPQPGQVIAPFRWRRQGAQ
ncbi:hypothetical protein ABT263_23025 [Kitasatospora sp. NPDC001603]|uniref:hypothetical protein n=1 Tax=Kitasatospora sp. NPDC001603 TaxID=3154388 RepID=UPI00332825FB